MADKDSFFSMDRLVEFGMGMAMSQQIAQSMNNMMAQISTPPQVHFQPANLAMQPVQVAPAIPTLAQTAQRAPSVAGGAASSPAQGASEQGAQTPPKAISIPEVYYVSLQKGKSEGPYSGTEIARLVMEKKVVATTPVWMTGMAEWKTAADFPDLVALIALVPPEMPSA